MAHQATVSSNRAAGREAAEPGRHRLRPGLELAEVAGADDDAALERRQRSPVTRNSRAITAATIHAGRTSPTSMISAAITRSLSATGSRMRPRSEVRLFRRAHQPSTQSVAIATAKTAVAQ